jgi:uncharacterized protein (DUF58 family)
VSIGDSSTGTSGPAGPIDPARGGSSGDDPYLLEPALLARLERLQLGTRRPLSGRFGGDHRSRRYGTSLDFADYREYHPGDDFRRIDYQLYARLDVLLIKLFDAEDDLTVRLLLDTSASMAGTKLRQAIRVAAALGFVSLVRRDAVTVHTFPLERPAPRFAGRAATLPLFRHLARLRPEGDTRFARACTDLLSRPGPPGVTVVISDLLTDEWEQGLSRLPARGGLVVVVHVLDREELHPALVGDYDFVDRETGTTVAVSLSPATVADYERLVAAWTDEVAARCRRAGATYVRLLSDEDLGEALLGGWRDEGVLR